MKPVIPDYEWTIYGVRVTTPAVQVNKLLQLRASLELDGFLCTEGNVNDAPLKVELNGRSIALGCYPGLIGRPEFQHAVYNATNVDARLGLNEYLLRSNLPEAHQKVRSLLR